ncbi:MAG: mannose-1-phosphate guanylyltransferase [Dethiobacter sp.]|jgi:mannose-1-phosphate guanylyltransferase|nr:MAG: mannose-1-phosphate guanylyltransferase [Dethiobacter sp.]
MGNYAVIMAGGKGERFWPWSRSNSPKQFLSLIGERSLIQQTVDRLTGLFPTEKILVVTGEALLPLVREHLPGVPRGNMIAEPVGRNTAPCIGLAAMRLLKEDSRSVMLVLPADHLVIETKAFLSCLARAMELASAEEVLVTIGITPTRPETGYGYIEKTGQALTGEPEVYRVQRFVEKPDRQKALEFLSSGRYVWNSGIFAWKARLILEKIQKHLPDLYERLEKMGKYLGTAEEAEALSKMFPAVAGISIDYGVMEKEKEILLVQGNFGWDDLGSWTALAEQSPKDEHQNVSRGQYLGIDTTCCLVYGQEALIATLGVSNLVIVQTNDVVLVCSMEHAQEIKELVNRLKAKGLDKYL